MSLQKLLKVKSQKLVGLDIGPASVALVQMSHNEDEFQVTAAAMSRICESESDTRQYRDIKMLRAISDCYNEAGMKAKDAVCSICGPEVAVRDFEFPVLPTEELESAVALEASQVCPFDAERATTDYQLIASDEQKVRGILVSATDNLIKSRVRLTRNASLNCVLLDVDGLALLNCLKEYYKAEPTPPAAVLNVNERTASLAIMLEDQVPFVRDLVYSNHTLSREIAGRYQMPVDEADRIVREAICTGEMPEEFSEAIRECVDQLAEDVGDSLRYFATQGRNNKISNVFVCGNCAKLFFEDISGRVNHPMVLWNPFESLRCDVSGESSAVIEEQGPALAVAAGLAMRKI